MTQHTPGPWRIADTNFRPKVFAADGRLVADCANILRRTQDEMEANARLITAAPDMLLALEGMIQSFHESVVANPNDFPALRAAVEAINKAKGLSND